MKRKTFAHRTFLALSMLACGLLQHCKPGGGIVLPEKPGSHPSLADKWRVSEVTKYIADDQYYIYRFTYNEFNKAIRCKEREFRWGDTLGYRDYTYYYDAAQRLVKIHNYDSSFREVEPGTTIWYAISHDWNYTYDGAGRVINNKVWDIYKGDTSGVENYPVSYRGDSVVLYDGSTWSEGRFTFDQHHNQVRRDWVDRGFTVIIGPYDPSPNITSLTTVPVPMMNMESLSNYPELDVPIFSKNNALAYDEVDGDDDDMKLKYEYNTDSLVAKVYRSAVPPFQTFGLTHQIKYIKVQ